MTAPNPAVGARPGTFFVDRPDGFVWWVTSAPDPSGVGFRWARFYGLRATDWDYTTQEEAEAADLVNVYASAPAPLDSFVPDARAWAYRQAAMALDPELYAGAIDDLRRWADEAEDRARAEEYARAEAAGEDRAVGGWDAMRADVREWHIRLALRVIRAERARAEATS